MTSVTQSEARVVVYQRFIDQWTTAHPEVPYTFSGEAFETDNLAEWVRVSVRQQASAQETLGGTGLRRFNRAAAVFIQVFAAPNQGEARLDALMQSARAIFEGVSVSGLRFFAVEATEQGEDGKWIAGLVEAPFDYEETK